MATTGKQSGTLVALYMGGVKIAHLTSNSDSHTSATRDVTTKDSAGWEEVIVSLKSWEKSADGYFAEDSTYGYEDLYDAWAAGTALVVMVSSQVAGDVKYSGSAYITSLQRTAPKEETMTFSVTLKGTGAITKATVA